MGLGPKIAKHSDDYVEEIRQKRGGDLENGPRLSRQAKTERLALVLSDKVNGIQRLGVGMVGPIQLKLRYQGIIRNVLIEDPVTPGTPVEYDVWDDLGQAYTMSGHDGEVRVTPMEGKRVPVNFFRIASFPSIRYEDLYYLRLNSVEQAQDETKQSIMKQEDARLMVILLAALTSYATRPDHTVTPNHTVTEASGFFTPQSLYTAVAQSDAHELPAGRVLVNQYDARDFYRWDINQTGWAFKDRVVAGETITSFGEFEFQKSVMVPQDRMYVLPNPDFLGVFPLLYSLQVEENHNIPAFWRGWVFHEMVSMAILNPRGITTIVK
jgi:hypothetical protein